VSLAVYLGAYTCDDELLTLNAFFVLADEEGWKEMDIKPGKPLPAQMLYRFCDPGKLSFKTTESLEDLNEIPGQERAVEAIHFATGIDVDGHNVFVLGPPGTGRHTFVRHFLEKIAADRNTPSDWCYVYNFEDPRQPKTLELPAGVGKNLRIDIANAIEDAQTAIPAAFESEDFQLQNEAITDDFKEQQEQAFMAIEKVAKERGINLIQTPNGIAFIPMKGKEVIKPEEFEKLPKKEQDKIHKDIEELTEQLQRVLRSAPKRAREMRQKLRQLEHDVAGLAVTGLIDELKQKYKNVTAVLEHLSGMHADIIDNVGLFLKTSDGPGLPAQMQEMLRSRESAVIRRYTINVLVDGSDCKGAPVVFEDKPSFPELIGKIEYEAEFGSLVTNFSLIRAGALHRANGGYLVLDAAKVLSYPLAWEGLKRAVKSRQLQVRSIGDDIGLVSTVSLEPQPIPLDLKVILIGERIHYYLLDRYDPEFSELFKVAADFEDRIDRNNQNVEYRARMLATVIRQENLKHLDRSGVARLVEESTRHAGDNEWLSADIRQSTDILREAHYRASHNGNKVIGAKEVQQAIDARIHRASRYRDQIQDGILRDTLRIETSGARIGQVNGLAVTQLGGFAFGRPQRITATVSLGSGKVIDIEREVELGGPLHSKGVLILTAFLSSHYVTDRPLSLSASLVFEQSYGGVDGDSASAAELCVLASSLSELPIKQSLAITGSLDQHGTIQAIGGVNEKIEGFFDICNKRGLSGDQGVLIPLANVRHLMLRDDVIDAVKRGQFHVYPVGHVDQCLEILTGTPTGERDKNGEFPVGSVNHKIRERLLGFADQLQAFSKTGKTAED
jgi:lon-related putative ATP-dependent protease